MRRLGWVPRGRAGLALGVAVLVSVGSIFAVWRALTLQQTAQEAREHLGAARAAFSEAVVAADPQSSSPAALGGGGAQMTSACAEAAAAADSLQDVNGQVQTVMPLIGALESLPGVGARARSQTATLQAGTELASAGVSLCAGLGPLTSLLSGGSADTGPQSAAEIMQTLASARPKIAEATQRLDQLQVYLAEIQDADLDPSNREAVVALRERLPRVLKTLGDARVFLDLMGAEQPRRYLLVSQNPDELRGTGGYIGSAGVIEASASGVRLVEYGTSRRYDTPPDERVVPPGQFQAYLGQNSWNFAAANWWASFPDAARQLVYFHSLSNPRQPIDGVIALDQFGLSDLLRVIGPVDVPEFGERVGAADVEAKLDQYVHVDDQADESLRKQFTAALSAAVLKSLMAAPRATLTDVVKAVRTAFDAQHLLVWTADSQAAQLFASRRWDGALLPADGDSLMLVDSDVGGSKKSQAVKRDVTYAVTLADGESARASLAVTYTNNAVPQDILPEVSYLHEYRTFLRVFVPTGATLASATGFDGEVTAGEECGRRVFGGQVTIADQGTTAVKLDYQLPAQTVSRYGYELLVQQQPGIAAGRLDVAVLTAGGEAGVARTELVNAPGQHARWRLDLADRATLKNEALPEPAVGGCGTPVVEARYTPPPLSLQIASAHIDASVVDLGVADNGEMEAPPTPDVVGWYRMSARPGQPGNSVMSGHVDWGKNTAIFWGLGNLRRGDPIQVSDADGGVHTYAVEWNESYPWNAAPLNRIVGPTSASVLTLITCDGAFDARSKQYVERRVVRARLID